MSFSGAAFQNFILFGEKIRVSATMKSDKENFTWLQRKNNPTEKSSEKMIFERKHTS